MSLTGAHPVATGAGGEEPRGQPGGGSALEAAPTPVPAFALSHTLWSWLVLAAEDTRGSETNQTQ